LSLADWIKLTMAAALWTASMCRRRASSSGLVPKIGSLIVVVVVDRQRWIVQVAHQAPPRL